jgi:hypothetical protein
LHNKKFANFKSNLKKKHKKRKKMDLVSFVGCDCNVIASDEERDRLQAFIEAHPPGDILQVRVFANFDAKSEAEPPSGMQVVFKPEAKVDPTDIHSNMFQTLSVANIVEPADVLNDDAMKALLPQIHEAIPQVSDDGFHGGLVKVKDNKEMSPWHPELRAPGSFVTIVRELKDDHRSHHYMMAARSAVPRFVQDLKRDVGKGQPTWNELVQLDSSWCNRIHKGEDASRRNVAAVMADTAENAGIGLEYRVPDILGALEDERFAHRELALPHATQVSYSIRPGFFERHNAVVVSYGIVNANDCLKSKNFYVVSNMYDGISRFRLNDLDAIAAAGGLPADTGRAMTLENIPLVGDNALKIMFDKRSTGFTWDGKQNTRHPDLHAKAFRPLDQKFLEGMEQLGWDARHHSVKQMIPIVGKINNPVLKK